MKTIDRYLLKEFAGYSLLALLVFTFVLAIPEVARLSELVARQSTSWTTLFLLLTTVLPSKLIWTIPMAVLVGLLVGWSRLAMDGEVIALQASAIGFRRLLWPSALFTGVGFLLALTSSLWWTPQAARQFRSLQAELAVGELASEVQARVFDERFPNWILYVQDVESGGARWKGVLLADASQPAATKLTLAESGVVVNEPARRRLQLHLQTGSVHEHLLEQPERYSLSTFAESDRALPWPTGPAEPVELGRNAELALSALWVASRQGPDWRTARVDFHRRLVLPASCLVLALLGIPLGLRGGRGGRSAALVGAFVLLAAYYTVFVFSDRLAREGVLSPGVGVWMANLVFGVSGVLLLLQLRRPSHGSRHLLAFLRRLRPPEAQAAPLSTHLTPAAPRERSGFPRLLDLYMVRGILFHFLLLLASFLLLFELFNLLDLIDEIAQNQVGWDVVGTYLWYLLPQALYWMTPLSALLAVLVELGLLSKRNELIAIKAAGISLYRIAAPALALGLLLALGLFALDYHYLPASNQRQEALRNQIRGRPPQTVYQPQRKWVIGRGQRVFHYRLFDARANLFGQLSILQLDPERFTLQRRIFARQAHWEPALATWILIDGWKREFDGNRTVAFEAFPVASFPEINEPPDYFKREVLQSSQMNFRQLRRYLSDLRQAGFEVSSFAVEYYRKFAFPLTTFVMMLLAFPYGVRFGRRGALGGVAAGIALGLSYWVATMLFEAMGKFQLLPPLLAGWGPILLFMLAGVHLLLHIRT